MDKQEIRILSLEAKKIFEHIRKNGEEMGYELPAKKTFAYFSLFKNILDYSLDSIELENAHIKHNRRKFSFVDQYNNTYTLAVINLKFSRAYTNESEQKSVKELREYFYEKGFNLDGTHYIRYKRSSGSSRQGKCLFIDENLYKHMQKWGECGLNAQNGDLASWEAYKALSLSSLKGLIDIPLEGILFIPDYKSKFEEEVVCVEEVNGELQATLRRTTVENDIWDGESLLDESLFVGKDAEKHMFLLRNKFFKSCGFRTKLKQWFKDKNITLEDLKNRGFITFATDIDQIVMVTTPNSMKFLKFMKGGFSEKNVRKWLEQVDSRFGVVKSDKRTRFFGGEMVQSSYQFINTLGLTQEQAEELLQPSKNYLAKIRDDLDFMRYHFSDAYKREKEKDDEEDEEISDGLAERCDVIFKLMQKDYGFKDTRLYYNFRNDVVQSLKDRLKEGHILVRGTNATLFGNGPEMLLALSGEFDLRNMKNEPVALKPREVACAKFENGEKLVGARSPHVTMGNIYCVTNNLNHDIWKYFDLGENIVCVNAIKENIQQRLNGCDYDSDTMLITNDKLVVETAFRQKDIFKVPVCGIASGESTNESLSELDYNTSQNKVGEIINSSQKLNSLFWDWSYSGCGYNDEKMQELYKNICKLAVLSGIEIDKAKRSFPNVNVASENTGIASAYKEFKMDDKGKPAFPEFFKEIHKEAPKQDPERERSYTFYNAPMEYIYKSVWDIDFRQGRVGRKEYRPICSLLKKPEGKISSTVYDHKNKIIEICEEYQQELKHLYNLLRKAEEDERELIYERIKLTKNERNAKVEKLLTEERVLYLVIKELDKGTGENWHLYAPLLGTEMFEKMLSGNKKVMQNVTKKIDGEIDLFGLKFTKI